MGNKNKEPHTSCEQEERNFMQYLSENSNIHTVWFYEKGKGTQMGEGGK